ncbi:hypothetical protein F0L68_12050 [Solihabitans fulvus]|uniref:LPXTG-motif cell wall anchor domain-containing protein n=1 Tax=Solihabitans fulvus TaxID=1892852 RepID=A0A5B2XFM0_9PSEU|nr:choice-of-anchor P family protein [Solihabitans fulvus]KAA2262628.1 hypothetical protein F0L68_12050 [Solihabitans fulvus]
MRSSIVRRGAAVFGVAALGLLIGAGPAFADTGTAYAKAELINVGLLNVNASPVRLETPPNHQQIPQPSVNIAGLLALDLVGGGLRVDADPSAGTSSAEVNMADAKLTANAILGKLVFQENGFDVKCSAQDGNLTGGMTLASASVKLTAGIPPFSVDLVNVALPVDPAPNTGVDLGPFGSILLNKQVVKDGVITVTGFEFSVAPGFFGGGKIELGKTTCGPNNHKPDVPLGSPIGLAAGVLVTGVGAGALVSRRRKELSEQTIGSDK